MKKRLRLGRILACGLILVLLVGLLYGCGSSAGQEEGKTEAQEADTSSEITASVKDNNVLQLNGALPTGDIGKVTKINDVENYTEEDVARVTDAMRAYTPSVSEGLLINEAKNYFYYDNITGPAKSFYEAMQMVSEDPVSSDYYISVTLDEAITQEDFNNYYMMAYNALCFDHPELFWLYNYSKTSIAAGSNDFKEFFFFTQEPYTSFEQDMKAFNEAVDQFKSQIDANASDKEKVRQIHDKLIDLVEYDYEVLEKGADPNAYMDLAHSAYGVLVANSRGQKNTAVCDGYSLAFQYLLGQFGIDAILVPGKAGSDMNSMGGHAWNLVKIDGAWYEIDSTWDDNMSTITEQVPPETEGYEYFVEAAKDPAYSDHITHFLYGLATPTIRDYVPKEEDYYQTGDGKYKLCLTGESHHYRADNYSDMGTDGDLAQLLPEAENDLK